MKLFTKKDLSLYLAAVVAAVAIASESYADSCSVVAELSSQGIKTPEDCNKIASGWVREQFPMANLSSDELCKNSSALPMDKGRCANLANAIKEKIAAMARENAEGCKSFPEANKICQKCANSGQAGCSESRRELEKMYSEVMTRQVTRIKQIRINVKELAESGSYLAKAHADKLKENELAANKNAPSNSAKDLGVTTPAEAILKHNGTTAEQALQVIAAIHKASTITNKEWDQLDQINSPIIYENLGLALSARQAESMLAYSEAEMEKSLSSSKKATEKLDEQNKNMASLSPDKAVNPAASNFSPLMGLAGGGAAMAGAFSGHQANASQDSMRSLANETQISSGSFTANSTKTQHLANKDLGPKSLESTENPYELKNSEQLASSNTEVPNNVTSSSRNIKNIRASIREKLNADDAKKAITGTSGANTDSTALSENGERSLASVKTAQEMQALGSLSMPVDLSGSGENFSMSQSETDRSVNKLVSDFESDMGLNSHSTDLASEQSATGISEAESLNLFERLHQFHQKCFKRGCVTLGGT
ncbi:MAG: hypothetical protein M9962_03175 [Oligoflexia bacterium]|nr:hypothetical protein [Oligoflexia bacterium]